MLSRDASAAGAVRVPAGGPWGDFVAFGTVGDFPASYARDELFALRGFHGRECSTGEVD